MNPWEIPTHLTSFTSQAIRDLLATCVAARAVLVAAATPETATEAQVAELEDMVAYRDALQAELTSREDRAARFAAAGTDPVVPEPEPTPDPVPPTEPEPVVAAVTPEPTPAPTGVRVGQVAAIPTLVPGTRPLADRPHYGALVAAAGLQEFQAGQEITSLGITEVLLNAAAAHGSMPGGRFSTSPVAVLRRNTPAEFTVNGDNGDQSTLMRVANEANLPGGSLTAAGGWCAPSTTDYGIWFGTAIDGLADFPEVTAARGGVRHNTGLDWATIYGTADTNILSPATGPTGFFNLTEAQVIAGSPTKTCVQVSCPSFTDTRLGVTGVCMTSPILTNRGYPEFVDTFTTGVMAVHAHQLNALQIDTVRAGSTAVDLTAIDPWTSDGSVTSNILGAVEMAIVDIKYRLRLMQSATLEVILPYWLLANMRQDLTRRTAMDLEAMAVADSQIMAWFTMRGARPQFVFDYQDKFTGAASGVGGATPINLLPTTTSFIVYPAGTWVRAVQPVITLHMVYDSTLLATNMVTQLFTEDGWNMLQMGPVSRVYTVPTCPTGSTTAASQVDCFTP